MPTERNYYVLSDENCKFQAMTKEQTLTAIVNAVEQGEIGDINTGFVTTVKELNHNSGLKFWKGTQAEYNALENISNDTFYIVTNGSDKWQYNEAIISGTQSVTIPAPLSKVIVLPTLFREETETFWADAILLSGSGDLLPCVQTKIQEIDNTTQISLDSISSPTTIYKVRYIVMP